MAVYNGRGSVERAVDSVLDQTFSDFELILVDDGSTDGTRELLASYETKDPRVRLFLNPANLGQTRSLNVGLAQARGRYLARMDADDACLPERFERQVEFLEAHPEVGILGTYCTPFDSAGNLGPVMDPPVTDLAIRYRSLIGNPFLHPTVMLRSDILGREPIRYDEGFRTAQDYELWTRLLDHTRGANLVEPLVLYSYEFGVTQTHRPEQLMNHDTLAFRTIRAYFPGFEFREEVISQVRKNFIGGVEYCQGEPLEMLLLAAGLTDLLELFVEKFKDHEDLPGLIGVETERIFKWSERYSAQADWPELTARLTALNPDLAGPVAERSARAAGGTATSAVRAALNACRGLFGAARASLGRAEGKNR